MIKINLENMGKQIITICLGHGIAAFKGFKFMGNSQAPLVIKIKSCFLFTQLKIKMEAQDHPP